MRMQPYVDVVECTSEFCCYVPRAFNITCVCKHALDTIDQSVQHIYNAILRDKNIHHLLKPNPGHCPVGINVGGKGGHCGNVRDFLNECRCYLLDRRTFPHVRDHYEKLIVDAAWQILSSTPCTGNNSLNIAIFASGGLHGELVLMVKLLNRLRNNFEGTVNLFLIDTEYQANIRQAYEFFQLVNSPQKATLGGSFLWNNFLGQRQDLEQLLRELTLGLPSKIELKVHMFGDADDYILRAQYDANFRHDLLVGADIEMTERDSQEVEAIVLKLKCEARRYDRTDQSGVVLVKKDGLPQVCAVRSDLSKPACVPIPLPNSSLPQRSNSTIQQQTQCAIS